MRCYCWKQFLLSEGKSVWHSAKPLSTSARKPYILKMPLLSPSMTSATIRKWYVKSGDWTSNYQLILELTVKNLTALEENSCVSTIEMEILEELFVTQILQGEGAEVKCGEPLAIMLEESLPMAELSLTSIDQKVNLLLLALVTLVYRNNLDLIHRNKFLI